MAPYIVTSWHGHRADRDLPDVVRQVWNEKFKQERNRPRPGQQQGQRQPRQSNVDLAILDAQGDLVHWFDAFPPGRGPGRNIAQATLEQLQTAGKELKLSVPKQAQPVNLPTLQQGRGIRAMVTLHDDLMRAYSAPVVENVPLQDKDWQTLAYCEQETTLDASQLYPWLSQVYPPGVMERTDPVSKEAFRIERVEGQLALMPAGKNDKYRFMRLTGRIRLHDEGNDDFSFVGNLAVVLAYPEDSQTPVALQGVFEGTYPRYDRMHLKTRNIPLTAVFETIGSGS